ncbi:protein TRIGALACTOSYLDIACYLGLYCEROL 4, chloroplastic-like [Chenopodium quinoa]|uniref:protein TRIGALACTOSYLDIACYLGLYCEROL 4, chloroplastic-like n=1 Tax=Chenopodium quinoa TaxID=63459 RepID=UPI000B784975|nr:protein TRIGALACTOSYLDIACYLGLYCEROL 4, chloroplastic-like [Chenopodium quinoa]
MANLRTAMDALFWDLDIASTQNLDGCAKAIPGDPFPLDGSRAGKALRVQQLSFVGNGFPLGIIPSLSPTPFQKDLGSFSLQSLLLRPSFGDWWLGLAGQMRPNKLLSNIKREIFSAFTGDEAEIPSVKNVTRHVFDQSLYALALCTHIPITSNSSLYLSSEGHGERKGRRNKLLLFHKLPYHDITLNAAWPELFIDSKGRYWNVPESISLDCSSIISDSGLRYRFGVHKNGGKPQAVVNSIDSDAPAALLPGVCAKAAFSVQKSKDLWRQEETDNDLIIKTERGKFWRPAYDVRLKEPHSSISTIIGGTFGAWLHGEDKISNPASGDGDSIPSSSKKRSPVFADLFGSLCYTFQHGKFRKPYGDMTRVDARLDISSASAFAKNISRVFSHSSIAHQDNSASLPRLSLIFQQQVAGPIVFRADTKCVVDSPWKNGLQIEDFIYSLSYSLRLLRSGKVVAWYSPKRKEGMIELRVYEF